MKKTILLIVFTLFTYGCESKKSSVDKSNISESTSITGTYVDSRDGWTYILKSNGTFIHKTSMGTDRGTYKQNGNNIAFYEQGFETGSGRISGNNLTANRGIDRFKGQKKWNTSGLNKGE